MTTKPPERAVRAQDVVAANLANLIKSGRGPGSQSAIFRESGIAQATVGRILRGEVAAGIDTVQTIAELYGLQAWHLLLPGLNIANPQSAPLSESEARFYAKLQDAFNALPPLK